MMINIIILLIVWLLFEILFRFFEVKIKKETPLIIETIGLDFIFKKNFKKDYVEIVEPFKQIDSFEEIL